MKPSILSDVLNLRVMIDALEATAASVTGVDEQSFCHDRDKRDACLMRLLATGEYAGKMTEEIRQSHPEVPWSGLRKARDYYAHAYRHIDWPWVYQSIDTEFLPTLPVLRLILAGLEQQLPKP